MTFVTGGLVYPVVPSEASESSAPTGTSATIDWSISDVQILDLTGASGDVTVAFTNPVDGRVFQLITVRDGSSPTVVAWPSNVKWPGGMLPVLQPSSNGAVYDVLQFVYASALDVYVARDLSAAEAYIGESAVLDVHLAQNAVTNAALRDSSALSVIGRAGNSTGDPADIAATPASGAVLRESGSTLAFGTLATAGIADDAVTNPKLRNSGALSVIGRATNSSGDPADIAATAATGAVLRESGSTLGFGTIATAGIADNAVDDTKLRNAGALSVIGRSANSTGDPADISASAASGAVLRESGSTLGFGTIATAGLANNAVDDTKLRDSAGLSVIGRSASTTGDPADIAAGTDGHVMRRSGTSLGFGTLTAGGFATGPGIVTPAMLDNGAARSVMGRSANSSGARADIAGGGATTVLSDDGSTLAFRDASTLGLTQITRIAGNSGAAGKDVTYQYLTSASSVASTTPAVKMSTTGVGGGLWRFRYTIRYTSGGAGEGIGFNVNHTGTTTTFLSSMWYVTTGTAAVSGVADQVAGADQLVEGKAERVKNTTSSTTTGVDTASSDCMMVLEGMVRVTVSGTLELKCRSETGGTVTVGADTMLELEFIG